MKCTTCFGEGCCDCGHTGRLMRNTHMTAKLVNGKLEDEREFTRWTRPIDGEWRDCCIKELERRMGGEE